MKKLRYTITLSLPHLQAYTPTTSFSSLTAPSSLASVRSLPSDWSFPPLEMCVRWWMCSHSSNSVKTTWKSDHCPGPSLWVLLWGGGRLKRGLSWHSWLLFYQRITSLGFRTIWGCWCSSQNNAWEILLMTIGSSAWSGNLMFQRMVSHIPNNINPRVVGCLRGMVRTVEQLVKLGWMEKNKKNT